MSVAWVYTVEAGSKHPNTLKLGSMKKLAKALDVPYEYLVVPALGDEQEETDEHGTDL
jgi:hypothetical protein